MGYKIGANRKMRVLFDMGHPAHVHLFKNIIINLKRKSKIEFLANTRIDLAAIQINSSHYFGIMILCSMSDVQEFFHITNLCLHIEAHHHSSSSRNCMADSINP